jgi:hypothetical protein
MRPCRTVASRIALALTVAVAASCASPQPASKTAAATTSDDARALVGVWLVDLRPLPTSDPYVQRFEVTSVDGRTFTGTFYGAAVREARVNIDWNAVRIAFVTEDASGPYYHSAVLKDGRLEGLSNSSGRDFLAYWSATKDATPGS